MDHGYTSPDWIVGTAIKGGLISSIDSLDLAFLTDHVDAIHASGLDTRASLEHTMQFNLMHRKQT